MSNAISIKDPVKLLKLLNERKACIASEITHINKVISHIQSECNHSEVERHTLHTSTFVICQKCGFTKSE